MRKIIYILISIFISSCITKHNDCEDKISTDKSSVDKATLKNNFTKSQSDSFLITKEYLDLIRYIDSSGYICDSSRFKKTYNQINQERLFKIDNYLFYELKVNETITIIEHLHRVQNRTKFEEERKDAIELQKWNDWKNRWKLNITLLEKAEKVVLYHYVHKSIFNGNNSNTYLDGIIEEWTFPDTRSSEDYAKDLAHKESRVYVNRGAYICYLNNHVYVFHSRSAGFYTPLKKFWNYFSEKNNAIIPLKNEQRKGF